MTDQILKINARLAVLACELEELKMQSYDAMLDAPAGSRQRQEEADRHSYIEAAFENVRAAFKQIKKVS